MVGVAGTILICGALAAGSSALAQGFDAEELRPGRSYFGLPSASAEANVLFGEKGAQVRKGRKGGGLLWLTVWLERVDHAWTRVVRDLGFTPDADADGIVEMEFERSIPALSAWLLVDLDAPQLDVEASAAATLDGKAFDLVAPSPFGIRPHAISLAEDEGDGKAQVLATRGIAVDVLWLRPAVGIWRAQVRDGDPNDLDGVGNRRIRFDASSFEAVYPEKLDQPESFEKGDVLVGIEEASLRAFVTEVERP